jgi:hypothetical protein
MAGHPEISEDIGAPPRSHAVDVGQPNGVIQLPGSTLSLG